MTDKCVYSNKSNKLKVEKIYCTSSILQKSFKREVMKLHCFCLAYKIMYIIIIKLYVLISCRVMYSEGDIWKGESSTYAARSPQRDATIIVLVKTLSDESCCFQHYFIMDCSSSLNNASLTLIEPRYISYKQLTGFQCPRFNNTMLLLAIVATGLISQLCTLL